ncbi:hypothetical protein GAYE_SCF51G6045 [Galdieria yellowstonensis]|uniref:D-arabinitol 2-dehydrogenase [ribulose-forming] n=1 Tax=Galdieria yellowstonensis TaxID=3028027 RepID=A0AAV9IM39_9RHOD|nr:hypothetical protein GAYE_SCF51G6045 [Galdieria yellowstonensis]
MSLYNKNVLDRFKLDGKIALVTGAAQGIGKALAIALAQAGAAAVGLLDLESETLRHTEKELNAHFSSTQILALVADVSNADQVNQAISQFASKFGRLDIACNNAGIVFSGTEDKYASENASVEQWKKTLDVDLTGVFICCQAEAKWMLPQQYGKIINTASMSAHIVNHPQKQAAYNAAKAGVVQLTRTLGAEWADRGVHVNCISPGYINTPITNTPALKSVMDYWIRLTPANRLGEVEDLQGPVVFLASDASSFMFGGEIIPDGGFTLW